MKTSFIHALFLCLSIPAVAHAQGCKREPAAQWAVRIEQGRPVVDGAINGTPIKALIHTAAYASLITPGLVERLKLKVDYKTNEERGGLRTGVAQLDELRIGGSVAKNMSVRISPEWPGVDFIVGVDFLGKFDLELDLPGGFVRAFYPEKCAGQSLAYWDASA